MCVFMYICIYINIYTGGPHCTNQLWAAFIRSMWVTNDFFFYEILFVVYIQRIFIDFNVVLFNWDA